MIIVSQSILRQQPKFWNHCVFHPTDAVEDAWGRRILDKIAEDGAIDTVRIYTMLEDIVYVGEDGSLCYDFRLNDLRLDYLVEKGYTLLLAYGGIPDSIASSTQNKTSVSKSKTRYKGKLWNSSPPTDYALWEEVCYEYTKHIIDRYGIETVKNWWCQCFNEPDLPQFFFSELPNTPDITLAYRLPAYCELYAAFARGVCRASDKLRIGGPALAGKIDFLDGWLDYVKKNNVRFDFISVHNYGTAPKYLNEGSRPLCVKNNLKKQRAYREVVKAHGLENVPFLVDEWGMSASGFYNREECPAHMVRETEVFSAYFTKLIAQYIEEDFKIEKLMICLSGQHEMTEDFSGFRNFFTLNFIKKPIYNAHILTSMLGDGLLSVNKDNKNIFVIPTKDESGSYAVILSYCSELFEENIPSITETMTWDESIVGKTVTIWCIDKAHTNPYRLFQKMGTDVPNEDQIRALREEGIMKPIAEFKAMENAVHLDLTPNATFLVTVK